MKLNLVLFSNDNSNSVKIFYKSVRKINIDRKVKIKSENI